MTNRNIPLLSISDVIDTAKEFLDDYGTEEEDTVLNFVSSLTEISVDELMEEIL